MNLDRRRVLRSLLSFSWLTVLLIGCSLREGAGSEGSDSRLASATTEFCLEGEWDLGTRYQGTHPRAGERTPFEWCVTTEPDTNRVFYAARGKANPDYDDSWSVAYLPPDLVRIVNRDEPPDVEFTVDASAGAQRIRRLDPRRLAEELETRGPIAGLAVEQDDGRVVRHEASVDIPLRGQVPVVWTFDWSDPDNPAVVARIDGETLLEATGRWRVLAGSEARARWERTPGAEPIDAGEGTWPTRIAPRRVDVAEGVFLVRGSRTGFQQLVVDTTEGLVIVDAPAGWVEFHHVPATDQVAALLPAGESIEGVAAGALEFVRAQSPDRPIRAVALTHFHDDHAGGAAVFARAGATVYAPAEVSEFLAVALGTSSSEAGPVRGVSVDSPVEMGSGSSRVRLVALGPSPHTSAILGVEVPEPGIFFVSDVHVPRNEDPAPRAASAPTECWFAAWAVQHLPASTRVLNAHSPVETPVSRLAEYLDSEACREVERRR